MRRGRIDPKKMKITPGIDSAQDESGFAEWTGGRFSADAQCD